jgi:hypothetical protein
VTVDLLEGKDMASGDVTDGAWAGVRARLYDLGGVSNANDTWPYIGEVLLESPLSPADMEDLESWLGVRLPSDYREFLTQVTVGGVGPYDGLRPVRRLAAGGWEWASEFGPVDRDLITTPFAMARMDDHTRTTLCGAPPFEEDYADADGFQHAFDEWAKRGRAGQGTNGWSHLYHTAEHRRERVAHRHRPGSRHHLDRLARLSRP